MVGWGSGGRGRPVHSSRALSQSIQAQRNDEHRLRPGEREILLFLAPVTLHQIFEKRPGFCWFEPDLCLFFLFFFYLSLGLNPHICNAIGSKMADPLSHFHKVMLGFVF